MRAVDTRQHGSYNSMIQYRKQKWFRLSVPVKTLTAATLSYAAALLFTNWAALHYEWDITLQYGGIPLKQILAAAPILFALFVFCFTTYFFFDRPFSRLTETISKAGEGDFLVRAQTEGEGEIGKLAENFNQMLVKLTDLSARKVQADHDLISAQEELKYKKRLEEKNRVIAQTNRALENLVKDLALLYEIGQNINQTIEVGQLYDVITSVLKKHLKLENFSLMIWDEKRQILEVKGAFGFEQLAPVQQMSFSGGEGVAGQVVKTGQPIYVKDAAHEPDFAKREVEITGSVFSAPLKFKERTMGVVNFGRDRIDDFSAHDIKMLTLVANQIALGLANAKLYTQTRELSVTDELTNVFNRRHFGQVMQLEWKRAVRFKRDLSLLMIDVDYFKRYNDTFGHMRGDEALKKMGKLLSQNLREVDTVARFGGEEFIVLLPDTDKRGGMAVAEKLRHLTQENVEGITISIGVTSFPEDVQEIDDLIDHADIALYDAKDRGRNRVCLYKGGQKPDPLKPQGEEKGEPSAKSRLVH